MLFNLEQVFLRLLLAVSGEFTNLKNPFPLNEKYFYHSKFLTSIDFLISKADTLLQAQYSDDSKTFLEITRITPKKYPRNTEGTIKIIVSRLFARRD